MTTRFILWRTFLILVLPIAGTMLWFGLPPERLREMGDLQLAGILVFLTLGAWGVVSHPLRPSFKIAALLLYVPAMAVLLFTLGLMTACFNDSASCP